MQHILACVCTLISSDIFDDTHILFISHGSIIILITVPSQTFQRGWYAFHCDLAAMRTDYRADWTLGSVGHSVGTQPTAVISQWSFSWLKGRLTTGLSCSEEWQRLFPLSNMTVINISNYLQK